MHLGEGSREQLLLPSTFKGITWLGRTRRGDCYSPLFFVFFSSVIHCWTASREPYLRCFVCLFFVCCWLLLLIMLLLLMRFACYPCVASLDDANERRKKNVSFPRPRVSVTCPAAAWKPTWRGTGVVEVRCVRLPESWAAQVERLPSTCLRVSSAGSFFHYSVLKFSAGCIHVTPMIYIYIYIFL